MRHTDYSVDGRYFAVGDRVSAAVDHPAQNDTLMCGDMGTIIKFDPGGDLPIGVCWDRYITAGHDLDDLYDDEYDDDIRCDDGHGWWVTSNDIVVVVDGSDAFEVESADILAEFLGV